MAHRSIGLSGAIVSAVALLVGSLTAPASAGAAPALSAPRVAAASDQASWPGQATGAAGAAVARLAGPAVARQVTFQVMDPGPDGDAFRVSAHGQRLVVEGSSAGAMLTGFGWYLKHVAHANIAITGEQLDLPSKLPLPSKPIEKNSSVNHRFALNDTNEGYTNPYMSWQEWEHHIDVLALHGINEALVYVGQEAVYYQTMQDFGYTAAEMRAWIPNPAHQPWWLLENLCCQGSPISEQLMNQRVELGRRIADRMRELGITPVFPGYYGTVPTDFEVKNPAARTVPQGDWGGFERPDWLDPTTKLYADVAADFYRVQDQLFGATGAYKMDLMHEGGNPGNVPLAAAAKGVQDALAAAHPDATWVILGWFDNPTPAMLSLLDKSRVFIVDGNSDFEETTSRDADFAGTPYAFGTIYNFGGHRNIGASLTEWNQKFYRWLSTPGTTLDGIALMPEAIDNNPAAEEFFTELPWHDGPVDMDQWFAEYATARYGGADPHATAAWQQLLHTAYSWPGGWGSKYATGLYELPPSLGWTGTELPYTIPDFDKALTELLEVAPDLRNNGAYRYDVVDVARQVLANNSQQLLPLIRDAYQAKDLDRFRALRDRWLGRMRLEDDLLATNKHFMLGPWLKDATNRAGSPEEAARLEYDARSLITVWGKPAFADYAAREWSGLIDDYYVRRWSDFFDTLEQALVNGGDPQSIDWYAYGDAWAHEQKAFATEPTGDPYQMASKVRDELANDADLGGTLDVSTDQTVLHRDQSIILTATLTNNNGFVAAEDVDLTVQTPDGIVAQPQTDTSFSQIAPGEQVTVRWAVSGVEGADADNPLANLDVTATYHYGDRPNVSRGSVAVLVPSTQPGSVYLSDLPFQKAENGWGPVERDMHNGETAAGDGGPLVLDGVTYPKGLGANSIADIEFNLGGLCSRFHSVIGIDDTMTVPGKDPDVVVKIYSDDRLLYNSGLIDETTPPATVDLDIAPVDTLRLIVEQYDQDFFFDRTDFADAKVTCGGQ